METITIGPYFTAAPAQRGHDPVVGIPLALEWASEQHGEKLPIFKFERGNPGDRIMWHHVLVDLDDIPFEVTCAETQIQTFAEKTYIPLDALLCELYKKNRVTRPLKVILAELADRLTLGAPPGIADSGLLREDLERAGYVITHVFRETQNEILIRIGWQANASLFHVVNVRFLSNVTGGEFISPTGEAGVGGILSAEFVQLAGDAGSILTAFGIQKLRQI